MEMKCYGRNFLMLCQTLTFILSLHVHVPTHISLCKYYVLPELCQELLLLQLNLTPRSAEIQTLFTQMVE